MMFSGGAAAALSGTAMSTTLLIIGMTVAPIAPEAEAKFYDRIVLVAIAAGYVIGAFVTIDMLLSMRARGRRNRRTACT